MRNKKKVDSPFETIQILKADRAKLFDLAFKIKEAKGVQDYGFGDNRTELPHPATMVGYAVDALEHRVAPTADTTEDDNLLMVHKDGTQSLYNKIARKDLN